MWEDERRLVYFWSKPLLVAEGTFLPLKKHCLHVTIVMKCV
jgi:hypothetical protein